MKKLTTEEWIKKAKVVRGDRYNYSKVQYNGAKTKICIICPEHGEFWQTPSDHISKLANCPLCGKKATYEKQRLSTEEFIEKAKQVHGDRYDYSKVEYRTAKIKIQIGCYKHGWFWQKPNNHLYGQNCPECGKESCIQSHTLSTEEFIQRARGVHGDKYNYSKANYINSQTKICIICPIHGEFEQIANNHIKGAGCPKCSQSQGERLIENYLKDNSIEYISQYEVSIDTTINSSGYAYIDFYLPEKDIYIEYNGIQHYKYVPFLHKGGIIDFNKQIERDNFIRNMYKKKLIEFSYLQSDEEILEKLNEFK